MKIPILDKEAKIYILIAIILFVWISFLPEISMLIDRLLKLLK
jgi:hypothetical protein